MRTLRWAAAIVLLFPLLTAAGARALELQPVGSFNQPIYVTSDPGDPNRLFVVERSGTIELLQGGTTSTFVNLTSLVRCCDGERGLWSMALAPSFDTTGHFYVAYSGLDGPGNIHVDELTAVGDSANLLTRRPLLTIPHTESASHHGGQLQFGPDGYLYVSTGDGGGSNDQFHHAQDLSSLLGKILRIDPIPSGGRPYTVPAGNPFPAAAAPYDTIWSYGLRNPFRFSFDRATGDMAIGDVGQSVREEVDYAPFPSLGKGSDYGWNCREGSVSGPPAPDQDPQCSTPPVGGFVDPSFEYAHTPDPDVGGTDRCAIIGGYVVRDPDLGDLYGRYLYTDVCSGEIRSLSLDSPFATDRSECLHVDDPNSFGEDSSGRIYVVSGGGEVYRLQSAPSASCPHPPPSGNGPGTPEGSFVRIRAERRTVQRGHTAFITVWVSPCERRKGQSVRLFRGRHPVGSKHLDRACAAHFHPRVPHRSVFKALFPGGEEFLPAASRRLKIRTVQRLRRPSLP